MKTSTSLRLAAAAGVVSLASLAQAQSVCAINCFQGVITDHPPLDCKEENMYLCFCKAQDLQNYFLECVWDTCGDKADDAISFGVNLCAEYGIDIDVPDRPEPEPTTAEETQAEETQAEETQAEETQAEETQAEETQAEETKAEETQAQETQAAETTAAAEETEKPTAPKPTSVVPKPSHSNNATATTTTLPVVVNMGASNAGSGVLALAGVAMAAFQLLHLQCCLDKGIRFSAVSHVWDPDISYVQQRRRTLPQTPAAAEQVVKISTKIFIGIEKMDELAAEIWLDYISVSQALEGQFNDPTLVFWEVDGPAGAEWPANALSLSEATEPPKRELCLTRHGALPPVSTTSWA
ncbi:hypothetical protein ACJZ2D_014697 [Fusarium nematophilum]